MKCISITVIICVLSGCTSLKPIQMPAEQLQQKITTGQIILVGEKARLITADGKEYKINVIAVADGLIIAKDVEVPIVDVVAVETRRASAGKTTALVAGGVAVAYVIVSALAVAGFAGAY